VEEASWDENGNPEKGFFWLWNENVDENGDAIGDPCLMNGNNVKGI